jgi:CDP-diacylglycerol--serine O-phosphatidyltransferase
MNALSGFAAIYLAGVGEFGKAAFFVLIAMIADMLDGRVARMSHSTSSFGGQLDSLCDMVSFGVAPAYLMMVFVKSTFGDFAEMGHAAGFFERFIWLTAGGYLSCAAIRLARFNVENEEDESAHMSFIGLPSPAAAGVVVSLILFEQRILLLMSAHGGAYEFFEKGFAILLPFLTLGAGALMVSRIRYPHLVNQYFKGRKPLGQFIRILLILGLVVWFKIQIALFISFCGFASWGLVRYLYQHYRQVLRNKKPVSESGVGAKDESPA